jgi:hypothetical protein
MWLRESRASILALISAHECGETRVSLNRTHSQPKGGTVSLDMRFYKIRRDRNGQFNCAVVGIDACTISHTCMAPPNLESAAAGSANFDIAASILHDFLTTSKFTTRSGPSGMLPNSVAALVIKLHQKFSLDLVEQSATSPDDPQIIAGESVRRWLAAQGVEVEPTQEAVVAPC